VGLLLSLVAGLILAGAPPDVPDLSKLAVLCAKLRNKPGQTQSEPRAGTAAVTVKTLALGTRQHLSAGNGTKGARLYDIAYVKLADLEAAEYNEGLTGLRTRDLMNRRSIADKIWRSSRLGVRLERRSKL
jgi:hypothetical protein